MLGAGVFVAFAPAAGAAGGGLLVGLGVAGGVAFCNATSSARLAALYPQSGGTYVYGRERLGPFWGYLAGWAFVAGKTASCAAMAFTVGVYVAPDLARPVAVATVLAVTAVNYVGIRKSTLVTRVIVVFVLAVLVLVAATVLTADRADLSVVIAVSTTSPWGVLQAAGFLFFAFAGYARIATLGEEVRDPARTIPRAIPIALAVTLAFYALVGVTVLSVLGADGLAASTAPLADAARHAGASWLGGVVRAGAAVAATGSLLALVLGVSRTGFAMARDGHLPRALAAVHPRFGVPHRAEVAVGAVVVVLVLVADLRGAIGFSSFAVLAYYAVANASALTLAREQGSRIVPWLGLLGCVAVAISLPWSSIVPGLGLLALGAAWWVVRRVT